MNRIRHTRRAAAALPGLACTWLGLAAAAPAASAPRITWPPRPPGWNKHPPVPIGHVHEPVRVFVDTVVVGGMPGWQIALIAVGAALFAATAAVFLDRTRVARRKPLTAVG